MIQSICSKCNKELDEFGALLFGIPKKDMLGKDIVHKFHLCHWCYIDVINWIDGNLGLVTIPKLNKDVKVPEYDILTEGYDMSKLKKKKT